MNPWQRLKSGTPSVFATDHTFARKAPVNSGENRVDLGILSAKGEAGYVQRKAARSITVEPRNTGKIPQALRSTKG